MLQQVKLNYKEPEEIRDMVEEVVEHSIDNAPETELTKEEEAFIRKMTYSALVTLNMSGEHRDNDVVLALRNMAEIAFNHEFPDNSVSGYDRIYRPLYAVIDSWEKESKQKTNVIEQT